MSRKITDKQIDKICQLYKSGQSSYAIADCFNVSRPSICRILHNKGVPIRDVTIANRRCSIDDNAFDRLTSESLYWLGFIFADGSVKKRKGHSYEIDLRLSSIDAKHVKKFRKFLGSSHKLHFRKDRIDNTNRFKSSISVCVSSEKLGKRIIELGRYKKPNSKPIAIVANSKDFWRGVVDGDGCFRAVKRGPYKKRYPVFSLVGYKPLLETFLSFVQHLFPEFKGRVIKHWTVYSVRVSGNTAIKLLKVLYNKSQAHLIRKKVIADRLINEFKYLKRTR